MPLPLYGMKILLPNTFLVVCVLQFLVQLVLNYKYSTKCVHEPSKTETLKPLIMIGQTEAKFPEFLSHICIFCLRARFGNVAP